MGRGKIEIKRIQHDSNRQVTFGKRKNGIIKKASELATLCNVDVSLIIFSSAGKMYDFCSGSLTDVLLKYHKSSETRLWDEKHENLSAEIQRIKKENERMQIELRHLKGEDLQSLDASHLGWIEDALEKGSRSAREKQMEYVETLRKNDMHLEAQHKELRRVLEQQRLEMKGTTAGMHHEYMQQRETNFTRQLPLAFRVQPIQPNLHENK